MRFPLIDDATAVLRQVQSEVEKERGGIRFSLLYDIARARKLIPVNEQDWGLQAFRLPGDKSGDIFVHTRGTFGVASAAYWFGRVIAVAVRCGRRLLSRRFGLQRLIYADDGWLTAVGNDFWRKMMMWFFVYELLEIPVTWAKVKGGNRGELDWLLPERAHLPKGHQRVQKSLDRRLDRGQVGAGRCGRQGVEVGARASELCSRGSQAREALPGAVVLLGIGALSGNVCQVSGRGDHPPGVCEGRGAEKAHEAGRALREGPGGHISGRCQGGRRRHCDRWLGDRAITGHIIGTLVFVPVEQADCALGVPQGRPISEHCHLGADWCSGRRHGTGSGLFLGWWKRGGRYPLSIVAMELAVQLDLAGIDLQLHWVPRAQNQPADDLTNDRFDEFRDQNRLEVDFEKLPFRVMGKLLEKAGQLDSELN